MSYINIGRERDGLPAINSARRIKELEAELQSYRLRDTARSPTVGILKYNNGGETRRAVTELQDQVKALRNEVHKKDNLVQHLVSLENVPKVPRAPDSIRLDNYYTVERTSLDSARGELASIQVKYEKAQEKLHEYQLQLEAKDVRIREMEHIVEGGRESEIRLKEMVARLEGKLSEYESRADSFETVANRGEVAISTLQRENREANEKIAELECRLKTQLCEREKSESQLRSEARRLSDFLCQLSSLLYTDEVVVASQASIDIALKKLSDLIQENATLKGKILTMSEHFNETQLETKASRETIMRLVSEMGREQKVTTRYTADLEKLRQERDTAMSDRHDLQREVDLLRERLDANHRSLEATKAELELCNGRFSSMERNFRETSQSVHTSGTHIKLFKDQLVNFFSTVFNDVVPTEECLKECVRKITVEKQDLDKRIAEYEARIAQLSKQLEQELSIHRDMAQRGKRIEVEASDMAERLRIAEGELAAGSVLRDGFKFDKEKYLRGLQKLGEIMKMDRISLDLGLDLTMDALVARAEQLVKLEVDSLAEKSTHVYNLQRKLKALKEQLESKDLHIDLLRKKMTSLEERVHGRVDIERMRETESLRVAKLEKLVEKYKLQLQDSRHEVQNLKAQLMGSSELKVRTLEQRKDIEEFAKQIEELEEIRKRQSRKISELKSTVEVTEATREENTLASDNAVQALSSELRTTKNALDNLKYKEKQLLDFRTVVARMLGLDINTLAVPDYEIISRLEKLIQAHHTTAFTTLSLENALQDVEEGMATDYRHALAGTDTIVQRSRDRSRRKAQKIRNNRARSMSPMRRDPRQY